MVQPLCRRQSIYAARAIFVTVQSLFEDQMKVSRLSQQAGLGSLSQWTCFSGSYHLDHYKRVNRPGIHSLLIISPIMAARKKLSTKRKRNRGTGGDETPVETNSNKRFRPEDRKTIEPTTENLDNQESLEMQHDHVETAISQLTFNQPENTGSNQVPSQVQGAEKAIMVYDLTEEVNEDCLHLPDPKKDWGHHRWRPETNA